jgi:hypothetical protein
VALTPSFPPEPAWADALSVEEDPDLAAELTARMRPAGRAPRTSVTDLQALRPAFWRTTVGAPPVSPAREQVLEGGRRLHRILGQVFAPVGQLEVRVHDGAVHGRVDVLADRPIEIKTSAYPPPASDPLTERPEHVDQVAMYAALLGTSTARLVYLQSEERDVTAAAAFDLDLEHVEGVRAGMQAREERLRTARTAGVPEGLPRCPWFGRGCEFRGAQVCDCTGEEPIAEALLSPGSARSVARPDLAEALEEAVRLRLRALGPTTIHRFRDLLYPRRAYFEATAAPPKGPVARFEPETDTYSRLVEALDSGPVGEATRLPTLSDEPDEEVSGFRGTPVVVRTSRSSQRQEAANLVARSPQYALQLGFRCVATGTGSARLVLGYERAREEDRVQVFQFRFDPTTTWSRLWRARSRRLEAARAAREPALLPACPGWMFEECPYRDRCGCGDPAAGVQR